MAPKRTLSQPESTREIERRTISGTVRVRRRQHPRPAFDLRIGITGPDGATVGMAKNVSLGGMYIETDRPAAFGALIVIHVPLPGLPELADIEAIVRWRTETGMGIQFGAMGARLTFALTQLLREMDATTRQGGRSSL